MKPALYSKFSAHLSFFLRHHRKEILVGIAVFITAFFLYFIGR